MEAYLAEFIGTMILIILGDGVVAGVLLRNSKAENSGWIVITFGWAMAVADGRLLRRPVQRRPHQPRSDHRVCRDRPVRVGLVPGYIIAQFLGAFVGARHRVAGLPAALGADRGRRPQARRVLHRARRSATRPPTSSREIIGTVVLVFGVLGIVRERRAVAGDLSAVIATGLNPLLVGLLVLGIGLSLGGPTGYAINPARDLGPRIAHAVLPIAGKGGNDWGYSWIPVVAPIIGGILGAAAFTRAVRLARAELPWGAPVRAPHDCLKGE